MCSPSRSPQFLKDVYSEKKFEKHWNTIEQIEQNWTGLSRVYNVLMYVINIL